MMYISKFSLPKKADLELWIRFLDPHPDFQVVLCPFKGILVPLQKAHLHHFRACPWGSYRHLPLLFGTWAIRAYQSNQAVRLISDDKIGFQLTSDYDY